MKGKKNSPQFENLKQYFALVNEDNEELKRVIEENLPQVKNTLKKVKHGLTEMREHYGRC